MIVWMNLDSALVSNSKSAFLLEERFWLAARLVVSLDVLLLIRKFNHQIENLISLVSPHSRPDQYAVKILLKTLSQMPEYWNFSIFSYLTIHFSGVSTFLGTTVQIFFQSKLCLHTNTCRANLWVDFFGEEGCWQTDSSRILPPLLRRRKRLEEESIGSVGDFGPVKWTPTKVTCFGL